jgi:long-chain acyl-CoA synthetase
MALSETLARTFLEKVSLDPEQIVWEDYEDSLKKSYTFQSLYEQSRLLACTLMEWNVGAKEKMVLCLPSCWEALVWEMAALGASFVEVVLDPRLPASVLVALLEEVDARVLIVESRSFLATLAEHLPFVRVLAKLQKVIVLEEFKQPSGNPDQKRFSEFQEHLFAWLPTDTMSIVYTQGVSGIPRPIAWTHAQVMQAIGHYSRDFGGKTSSRMQELVVSCFPFSHAFGKIILLASLALGWKYCFRKSWSIQTLEEKRLAPTLFFGLPHFFEDWYRELQKKGSSSPKKALYPWAYGVAQQCTGSSWSSLSWKENLEYAFVQRFLLHRLVYPFGKRLKMVVTSAGTLPASIRAFFSWHGILIEEVYGCTETCGWVADTKGRSKLGGRWKVDGPGEIWVDTFQGWLSTGDLGSFQDHGLQFLGRKQDRILVQGQAVFLVALETWAGFFPWIHQCVVYGHPEFGLVALLTLRVSEVIAYAQEHQILFSAYDRLIQHPKILAGAQKSIDALNENVQAQERIRRFVILPEALRIARGELSVLGHFFRKKIAENYHLELKSMDEEEKQR